MAQFARPISDITAGLWTATPLWQKIDESVASDADFISCDNSTNDFCEVALGSVTDPVSAVSHIVRYRYRKNATSGNSRSIQIELYQGGTLIASGTVHTPTTTTWTAGSFTLTSTQANAITNYSDLRLRITATGSTGGNPGNRRSVELSWAEFEVPDAVAPVTWGQPHIRGRNDDASEATATWKAAVNTGWTQPAAEVFRLRITIDETGGGTDPPATAFKLQYQRNGGGWGDVNSSAAYVRPALGSRTDGASNTTQHLSSGLGTYVAGTYDEVDGAVASVDLGIGGVTELEFSIAILLESVIAPGDTLNFRVVQSGGQLLDSYAGNPTITVGAVPRKARIYQLYLETPEVTGPQLIPISLPGTLTMTPLLTRELASQRTLEAALTMAVALQRRQQQVVALLETFTWALGFNKRNQRSLDGAITLSGTVTVRKQFQRVIAASLTPSFAVIQQKLFKRTLAATLTEAPTISRRRFTFLTQSAGLMLTPAVQKRFGLSRNLGFTLTPTMVGMKGLSVFQNAALILVPVLLRRSVSKREINTTLQLQPELERRYSLFRLFGGSITLTPVMDHELIGGAQEYFRTLAGDLIFTAAMIRQSLISKTLSGSLILTTALQRQKFMLRRQEAGITLDPQLQKQSFVSRLLAVTLDLIPDLQQGGGGTPYEFPSAPIRDDYNRANGGIGSNYVHFDGTVGASVISNTARGAGYTAVVWHEDDGPDVENRLKLVSGVGAYNAVFVRLDHISFNGYELAASATGLNLNRRDNSAVTTLATSGYAPGANEQIALVAQGDTLKAYTISSAGVATERISTTDDAYQGAGRSGWAIYDPQSDEPLDDWAVMTIEEAGGGIIYNRSVDGSLNFTPTLARVFLISRSLASSLSLVGVLNRKISRLQAGVVTLAPALTRFAGQDKALSGVLTLSPALGLVRLRSRLLSVSLTLSATLARRLSLRRSMTADVILTGEVLRRFQARRTLEYNLNFINTVNRKFERSFVAQIPFIGTLSTSGIIIPISMAVTVNFAVGFIADLLGKGGRAISAFLGRIKLFSAITGDSADESMVEKPKLYSASEDSTLTKPHLDSRLYSSSEDARLNKAE